MLPEWSQLFPLFPQCLVSISSRPDVTIEKHCVFVTNLPPSSLPALESIKYGGRTHFQLAELMCKVFVEPTVVLFPWCPSSVCVGCTETYLPLGQHMESNCILGTINLFCISLWTSLHSLHLSGLLWEPPFCPDASCLRVGVRRCLWGGVGVHVRARPGYSNNAFSTPIGWN